MLAGEADVAVAYEPNVDTAVVARDARRLLVGDIHGPVPQYRDVRAAEVRRGQRGAGPGDGERAQQKGALYSYKYPEETKAVARKEFPDLDPKIVDAAIQRQLDNDIPAATFVVSETGWDALMRVGAGLGNCECNLPFGKVVDNSFAMKAQATVKL